MPPHPHHHIPPHIYPRIPPHQVCLCPYFTSTTIYVPYVVIHYPHIPSLGYLHTSSSRLTSSVLPQHFQKQMNEYRRNRRNRRSNEAKEKQRPLVSITDGENYDLVSISVDGSHEEQGQQMFLVFGTPK